MDENKTPGDVQSQTQTPSDVQGSVTPIAPEKTFTRTDIMARLGDSFTVFAAAVQAATIDIPMTEEHKRRTLRAMVHLCARYGHETLSIPVESISGQVSEAGVHEAQAIWKKLNPEGTKKAGLSAVDGPCDCPDCKASAEASEADEDEAESGTDE
jgi:hypothetical protein